MSRAEDIRRVAIDHHHLVAGRFVAEYAALESSRFSSAFTYGRAKIDKMVDALFESLPAGAAILDVGCGTGEHLKRALGHGLKPSGVEPAPAMLKAAEANVPDAHVMDGVATRLPFDDTQFDAVIMIEVLRYLDRTDIERALKEARRVLRPGGKLLVTLVNRWALDGFYIHQRLRQALKRSDFNNTNPFCLFHTPRSAERLLADAGFTRVRTEGRLFGPIRMAYKLNQGFGRRAAQAIEGIDDRVHQAAWTRPFAGHLVAIGEVPRT